MDLYVMQNCFGLIKIGRSWNVEERRRALEKSDRCQIALVDVIPDLGSAEEDFHLELKGFRITGEWFEGTTEAKQMISKILNPKSKFLWPFDMDKQKAADWLRMIEKKRDEEYWERRYRRAISLIRQSNEGSWTIDAAIWGLLNPDSDISLTFCVQDSQGCKRIGIDAQWCRSLGWHSDDFVPLYSSFLPDALNVWPEYHRPKSWEGSALECCTAGLKALRESWKHSRPNWKSRPRFAGPAWNVPPPDARNRLLSS